MTSGNPSITCARPRSPPATARGSSPDRRSYGVSLPTDSSPCPTPESSTLAACFRWLHPRAAGPDHRGHRRRRRAHRPGHGPLRGDGQPPAAQRRHRASALRLARDAPGQRLDRRAVPGLRPDGARWSRTPSASPGSAAPAAFRLIAPFTRAITGHSWAWTAGTGGKTLAGPVVLADLSTPDSLAVYKAKVRGAWVLPRPSYPIWNPDGPADDGRRLRAAPGRTRCSAPPSPPIPPPPRCSRGASSRSTCPTCCKAAGALGTLVDGGEGARADDDERVAQPGGAAAQPGHLPRGLHAARAAHRSPGRRRGSKGESENTIGREPVQQWNTVARDPGQPSGRGRW